MGGRIVAISGLSRKGDHVICQFGSIDEDIAADASPGELLFYLMIRKCKAEGVALFDFGIGDQAYKRSWCTGRDAAARHGPADRRARPPGGTRGHRCVRLKAQIKAARRSTPSCSEFAKDDKHRASRAQDTDDD